MSRSHGLPIPIPLWFELGNQRCFESGEAAIELLRFEVSGPDGPPKAGSAPGLGKPIKQMRGDRRAIVCRDKRTRPAKPLFSRQSAQRILQEYQQIVRMPPVRIQVRIMPDFEIH